MSTEAIRAVKEAEDQVRTMLEEAREGARLIREQADDKALEEARKIHAEAMEEAQAIRDQGSSEGETLSKPLLQKGSEEVERIKGIKDATLAPMIDSIVERIVRNHGNR